MKMVHGTRKTCTTWRSCVFFDQGPLEPQEKAVGGVAVLPSTGLNHVACIPCSLVKILSLKSKGVSDHKKPFQTGMTTQGIKESIQIFVISHYAILAFGCPNPSLFLVAHIPALVPNQPTGNKHPHRSRPKKKSLGVGISRCYISINLGVRLEVIVTNLVSWHISPVSGTVLQPTYMDVSENRGTPESSLLIGFSSISHPFWGTPIFGNTHI